MAFPRQWQVDADRDGCIERIRLVRSSSRKTAEARNVPLVRSNPSERLASSYCDQRATDNGKKNCEADDREQRVRP